MNKNSDDLKYAQKNEFHGPLFIVGVPRSGTKLLRDLLNRSPRIGIPDEESQFLPEFIIRYGPSPKFKDEAIQRKFIDEIEQTNFCRLMHAKNLFLDHDQINLACSSGAGMASIFQAVIRSFLPEEKAFDTNLIWGDKTPFYARHLPMIADLFPAARFIHIIRDPRDVAYSGRNAWNKSLVRSSIDWRDSIRAAWAFRDSPDRKAPFLEVKYENLLAKPESVIQKVCQFCEIEFRPEMLTLKRSTETWGDGKGITSILQNNTRKFENNSRKKDLLRIEELVYVELLASGYDILHAKTARRETGPERVIFRLIDGIRLMIVYTREKGFVEGIRYKFKQRYLRRST
jgi:hypothetical protein